MIVVIGVVLVLVTGIVAGTTNSLSKADASQFRTTAVSYAQEGVELTRALRDRGWEAFEPMGTVPTTYCVGTDGVFTPAAPTCVTPNIQNEYIRKITLQYITTGVAPKMSVTVVVTWGNKVENSVELLTYLTKWR